MVPAHEPLLYEDYPDMGPGLTESTETLRRLAATAQVAPPGLELRGRSPRWARVERRRDGLWVVIQPALLIAPEPVRLGVLAHEIAHIALGHPLIRHRMRLAAIAGILLMSIVFSGALILQTNSPNPWLLLIESVIWLTAMLAPRAILLAVVRRQEYHADRTAVALLGSSDPVIAFLDWLPAFSRPSGMPLILRLWGSTHPSPVARRQALLNRTRASVPPQPSSGR